MCLRIREHTNNIPTNGRPMNLQETIANIDRRLLALKGQRKNNIAQVAMLIKQYPYALTLASGDGAEYQITIQCGGNPIADVGISGLPTGALTIVVNYVTWTISGTTATANIGMLNITGMTQTVNIDLLLWALNGLSASTVRTY